MNEIKVYLGAEKSITALSLKVSGQTWFCLKFDYRKMNNMCCNKWFLMQENCFNKQICIIRPQTITERTERCDRSERRLNESRLLSSLTSWFCLYLPGSSVRTVSAPPAKRESGRLRWRCAWGTRFTTSSALSAPPARSTSALGIATFSSTQTLCVSRTSLSGPSSTTAAWSRAISVGLFWLLMNKRVQTWRRGGMFMQ